MKAYFKVFSVNDGGDYEVIIPFDKVLYVELSKRPIHYILQIHYAPNTNTDRGYITETYKCKEIPKAYRDFKAWLNGKYKETFKLEAE